MMVTEAILDIVGAICVTIIFALAIIYREKDEKKDC